MTTRLNDIQVGVMAAAAQGKVWMDEHRQTYVEGHLRAVTSTADGLLMRGLLARGEQSTVLGVAHTDLEPTETALWELAQRGMTAENNWVRPTS